jgi:hypothetical protein
VIFVLLDAQTAGLQKKNYVKSKGATQKTLEEDE